MKDTVDSRAVKIAAKVMQAAGLCRYESPVVADLQGQKRTQKGGMIYEPEKVAQGQANGIYARAVR